MKIQFQFPWCISVLCHSKNDGDGHFFTIFWHFIDKTIIRLTEEITVRLIDDETNGYLQPSGSPNVAPAPTVQIMAKSHTVASILMFFFVPCKILSMNLSSSCTCFTLRAFQEREGFCPLTHWKTFNVKHLQEVLSKQLEIISKWKECCFSEWWADQEIYKNREYK